MRTEIIIDGADGAGANYISWAPVHGTISLVGSAGGADPVDVVLRNQNAGGNGGQVVFRDAIPGEEQDTLQLRLTADGAHAEFFVAGKIGHPSVEDKDAVIEVVEANTGTVLSTMPLMVRIRKNADSLTAGERERFLSAFAKLNNQGMGGFRDFRDMHRDDTSLEAHGRAGFLPWHRAYLLDLERELQLIDPSVALPYWKFDEPAPNLFTRAFIGVSNRLGRVRFDPGNPLEFWATDGVVAGIERSPDFDTATSPAFVMREEDTLLLGGPQNLYDSFRDMEGDPHGFAHTSFGGSISQIDTAAKDPLFFLLHVNVDRLWAKWQWLHLRFDTTNPATYPFQGSVGGPGATTRIGHNLLDTMWPWNQVTGMGPPNDRPNTAPGGNFPPSPNGNAPGLTPTVGDMIDYQGVVSVGDRLGFDYDDFSPLL
jgi:tyrosinase